MFTMLEKLYSWYGKRNVIAVLSVIGLLAAVAVFLTFSNSNDESQQEVSAKEKVTVSSVRNINIKSDFTSVGTVEAISEAKLQTESSGRVTRVNTEIGKNVSAGSVLATLENASESAALLQAQGAYEAALASAASGVVGVSGAQQSKESALRGGLNTYQSTFITVDNALHDNIDDYFLMRGGVASGFSLDAKGQAVSLNAERTRLEGLFTAWATKKSTVATSNVQSELTTIRSTTKEIASFVERITAIVQDDEVSQTQEQTAKDAVLANLNTARLALSGALVQIENAQAQIDASTKALEQAELAGAQGIPSAASAQVKIALGSLRSAQAQYEKTLIRTPISGVVNALYLKEGEYAAMGTQAVVIANNNGLQVSTAVSEDDASKLAIGDTVTINDTSEGVITAIAGAIDPTTGKVQVKISVEKNVELSNGGTVSVTYTQTETETTDTLIIPLSAIKMTGSGPIAFEVKDNKLAALPLTLGEISGDSVEVVSGLTFDSVIVVDARGKKEGAEVEVVTN
jgi:RND family efflux transporter MFP subunit